MKVPKKVCGVKRTWKNAHLNANLGNDDEDLFDPSREARFYEELNKNWNDIENFK